MVSALSPDYTREQPRSSPGDTAGGDAHRVLVGNVRLGAKQEVDRLVAAGVGRNGER
jgi:hypothetical protein